MSIMQLTQTIHILPGMPGRQHKQVMQPALPGMEPEENAAPSVTNRQIAEVLSNVAGLLEFQNGNPYRIQAYRNAARGVLDLQEPVTTFLTRHESLPVPGLGQRLRSRIAELAATGTMTFYSDLSLPASARALMSIEHVGPRTAIQLYEELGIDSPEKLWQAAQQGLIRRLPGFGVRSEARLKEAVAQMLHQMPSNRRPLGGVA